MGNLCCCIDDEEYSDTADAYAQWANQDNRNPLLKDEKYLSVVYDNEGI